MIENGRLVARVFARFRAAYDELAPEEFLVVQFFNRAFRFFDRLHLHKRETFRALIVAIAHHFRVLHVPDAVEKLEQIALSRIERQIADVETLRRDFDRLRLTLRTQFALLLLLTVTRLRRCFSLAAVAPKKCDDALPKCFLLRSRYALLLKTPAPAPSLRPAAPVALASPV
jgi:hypothetical protein